MCSEILSLFFNDQMGRIWKKFVKMLYRVHRFRVLIASLFLEFKIDSMNCFNSFSKIKNNGLWI